MFLRAATLAVMTTTLALPALAADQDMLLVRKLENCAGLMAVISDNARAQGNAVVADKAKESSGQFRDVAAYYAGGLSTSAVDKIIAQAKEKVAYLYKMGGNHAIADDLNTCSSDEITEKGQEAMSALQKLEQMNSKDH